MNKIYTFDKIKDNIISFHKKLVIKNMIDNFWINASRMDFKPLKKTIIKKNKEVISNIHSINELKIYLLEDKGEYYKHKKLANINIKINDDMLKDNIGSGENMIFYRNKIIISVHITIYLLDEFGMIRFGNSDKYELKVNYYIDDLRNIKFSFKNIEILMRLASDKIATTNSINGISYRNLKDKFSLRNI